LPFQAGEVPDGTFLDCKLLVGFYEQAIQEAKASGVLFSLHLKATMMKVSDPFMCGNCVKVYFKDVFAKYADTNVKLGVDANNGPGDVYSKIALWPRTNIVETYDKCLRLP